MERTAITLDRVTKRFGKTFALKNISAQIACGEITGVVGPDGAGKTTLMRLLAGLMVADGGAITIFANNPSNKADAIKSSIGYMPQQFGLYEDLTVMENLKLYADLKGLAEENRKNIFDKLLTLTDLQKFTARLAGQLSGGMKQKLGLACALLTKPALLLLDDPGVGVDPISRRDLWSMVSGVAKEGTAILWSTAYLNEAANCDRVLVLDRGTLIFDGPPMTLTRRVDGRVFRLTGPMSKRTLLRQAISASSVIDGVIQGNAVRLVLRNANDMAALCNSFSNEVKVNLTCPRFEDAYIDLLGGINSRKSELAEAIPPVPPFNGAVIEAQNLTKTFGDFIATDNVSFSICRGEIFGLLGPNGAGKTTIFKMLCGLLKPTKGYGFVAGLNLLRDGSKARNRLGYMAQKFSLYGDLSVKQNLDFFGGIYGLDKALSKKQRELMIKIFNLENFVFQSSKSLPLGLKQRLSLAASIMHHPSALFLDEPTSGVDPLTRREFWNHINDLAEKGVTILVTTHFMDEAEYCDRIALIYQGKTIALGSPDELKQSSASAALPEPTLEDAFVELISRSKVKNRAGT